MFIYGIVAGTSTVGELPFVSNAVVTKFICSLNWPRANNLV